MSDEVQRTLIIAIAVVIVVAIALFLGRRLMFKHKDTTFETDRGGTSMEMSATGPGSVIDKGSQTASAPGGSDEMKMRATKGGQLKDVHQRHGPDGPKA
ncbi:MAG: hypothetical protein M3081_19980 [Gemmatimonadota bacterium]|nr:hypothetical protein [Gemmatimonadota bacterium]